MRAGSRPFLRREAEPEGRRWPDSDWPDTKATEEGRRLTVAATGNVPNQGQPSLTVADQGKDRRPTISLDLHVAERSNKLRIPFVQGKYNMGGTGALRFSELELIVSREIPRFWTQTICS